MSRRCVASCLPQQVAQNMTPLIDVVFQLLAFFVMTFRVNAMEGDFALRMPLVAPPGASKPRELFSTRLRLQSDAQGRLIEIHWGDRHWGDNVAALQRQLIELSVSTSDQPMYLGEWELDCDPQLHYAHVIRVLTALSGYTNAQGQTVRLIERIKLATLAQ